MHVAFNGYFWDQPRTGSGQYLRHLWDTLVESQPGPPGDSLQGISSRRARDTYTLLLPSGASGDLGAGNERGSAGMPARLVVVGTPTPLMGGRSTDLDKISWELVGAAQLARSERADLLHVPYLTAPLPVPGKMKMPMVVTAHDMIPWVVPGYSGSAAVRLYLALAAACVKRADLIMADSEASRQDVIRVLKVPPGKVQTVYLGMEPHPAYTPEQINEVRSRHDLPPDYAFYLGGFDRRKNVPLLLRAWRSAIDQLCADETVPEGPPVLAIGGGIPEPGGVFPDVRGEVEQLGFAEGGAYAGAVRFLGRVTEEDKPVLMAGARLFVYASSYEGFGLDPLEAMSVGTAVVSSSGGSLSEVVGDGGLLVPPGDPKALSEAVVRAWTDPSLRAELQVRGERHAARFTWDKTAQQTYSLYGAVLRRAARKHGYPSTTGTH
jgi:glycosyltransferase involved in cell wall biosynthesis